MASSEAVASAEAATNKSTVPLHKQQGKAPNGTPAYSNGNDIHFTEQFSVHKETGLVTGYQWQCVEFSRRWLLENKQLILPEIYIAAHLFSITHVFEATDTKMKVPVRAVQNGGTVAPVPDSLIIYGQSEEDFVGHVGVIVGVRKAGEREVDGAPLPEEKDGGKVVLYVQVADQNRFFHDWGDHEYSAEFPVVFRNGTFTIIDRTLVPLGWLVFPDSHAVSGGKVTTPNQRARRREKLVLSAGYKNNPPPLPMTTHVRLFWRGIMNAKRPLRFGLIFARILVFYAWFLVRSGVYAVAKGTCYYLMPKGLFNKLYPAQLRHPDEAQGKSEKKE